MMELTQAQKDALDRIWEHDHWEGRTPTWATKEDMLASVQLNSGYVRIHWAGIWLGI
jgi:hypothetical protein